VPEYVSVFNAEIESDDVDVGNDGADPARHPEPRGHLFHSERLAERAGDKQVSEL
jgi:hypothetical protein